ncbi:MAG: HDOD domain-containing protein [Dissulfurispiraceae bacterium]|jgi:HD-like signal output (HDOD) protein
METNVNMAIPQDELKRAEAIAASVGIPSQPGIVLDIRQEVDRSDADFGKIADLVARDVSLSAKVLKVANSPLFSMGRTDSILHALSLIGVRNFYIAVLQAALQEALAPYKLPLDQFWKHSQDVAAVAAHIAKDLKIAIGGQAYITGLFHDCGMTLMMRRFPSYVKTMTQALEGISGEPFSERFETVVGYENSTFNTNHCLMGYIMAKSWLLPAGVTEVILHHHHADITVLKDAAARKLLGLLHVSEFTALSLELTSYQFASVVSEWAFRHENSLREIGLNAGEMQSVADELKMILG